MLQEERRHRSVTKHIYERAVQVDVGCGGEMQMKGTKEKEIGPRNLIL